MKCPRVIVQLVPRFAVFSFLVLILGASVCGRKLWLRLFVKEMLCHLKNNRNTFSSQLLTVWTSKDSVGFFSLQMICLCIPCCLMHTWSLKACVPFHVAVRTLVSKTSWSCPQQVLQFSAWVKLASVTWTWLNYPENIFWDVLNSAFQIWQLTAGLRLLRGAERAVLDSTAACLEQNTCAPRLKYESFSVLDATSFLCGSKLNRYSFPVISKTSASHLPALKLLCPSV